MKRFAVRWPLRIFLLACTIGISQAQAPKQTDGDEYTRYELLAPETQSFRITYNVTVTTPVGTRYFNAVRAGSEVSNIAVTDRMSGAPLAWKLVDGKVAKEGGVADAKPEGRYIQIELARPVPAGGAARLLIEKTYKDPASYQREGETIVFARSLGIPRNSVVLPAGYELIGVNYPSQIRTEADGRIRVSFINPGTAEVPYRVSGRRLSARKSESAAAAQSPSAGTPTAPVAAGRAEDRAAARVNFTFSERAFQDRDIVYFLQQPETHAFRLYHDYTETREGMDRYLNVVRAGSTVADPLAKILDTGETLKVETLNGAEMRRRGIDPGEPITDETAVVVIWFAPVKKGRSVRLRIEETYTDANRYVLAGDELVWDRSFGRPRNAVVLPEGWRVTANSIPAVVSLTSDGQVQLLYVNDRPDNIDVFIRAKRR